MLEKIRSLNPKLKIMPVSDDKFKCYGRIIEGDLSEAIRYVEQTVTPPLSGNNYIPDVQELDELPSIANLAQQVYGYLEFQAGTVAGQNAVLNGIEYHQCSETIVAVTDYLLIVGKRYDMVGDNYDLELAEIFYVPQGKIVECYATTLHYTPCKVDDSGFMTICLLLKGTGSPLVNGPEGILKRKNKWFIAHPDNKEKVAGGDYPGLKGEMIEIKIR